MKQRFSKVVLAALATATIAVSCEKPKFNENPYFNSETNEVETKFILSVSTGDAPSTKVSEAIVQRNYSAFRGIDSAKIITYSTGNANHRITPSSTATKVFKLGTLYGSATINNSQDGTSGQSKNTTESSNRILQLNIPVGTDGVLVYGKAINAMPGAASGFSTGKVSENLSETKFMAAKRISTAADLEAYYATGKLMIYVINDIINTSLNSAASYGGYTNLSAISWPLEGDRYDHKYGKGRWANQADPTVEISPLEEILGSAYSALTYIKDGEYRAGSATAIKIMVRDMIAVVRDVAEATPTNADEANAKRLAESIMTRAQKYFDTTTWAYKSLSTLASEDVIGATKWAAEGFDKAKDIEGFPHSQFRIPDGAAQLKYEADFNNNTFKFSYLEQNKALVTPGTFFDPLHYLYPVELCYYVNSPVRVNDKDQAVGDYPNGVNPWSTSTAWSTNNWTVGPVSSTTSAVAVKDNVLYGTALLQTIVAFQSGITSLQDNKAAMTDDSDNNTISISNANFELTGVLVGGVTPVMDWQFLRKDNTSAFDGVIYDDVIANGGIYTQSQIDAGGKYLYNSYTPVWDNYDSSKGDNEQSSVYVALEFQNNGASFWGRENLIPSGSKFYLVGLLNCNPKVIGSDTAVQTITWPTYNEIPPVFESGTDAGKSKKIARVFIQDFVTKAVFRIGENSLKHAYYSTPDLRASNMSLGLSVDLSWKDGFQYDIEL